MRRRALSAMTPPVSVDIIASRVNMNVDMVCLTRVYRKLCRSMKAKGKTKDERSTEETGSFVLSTSVFHPFFGLRQTRSILACVLPCFTSTNIQFLTLTVLTHTRSP